MFEEYHLFPFFPCPPHMCNRNSFFFKEPEQQDNSMERADPGALHMVVIEPIQQIFRNTHVNLSSTGNEGEGAQFA